MWGRGRRARARARAVELDAVRVLLEEDATYLGEQVQRLQHEIAGQALEADMQNSFQKAADAVEAAHRGASQASSADEVRTVTAGISSGHHAVACVQARLAGRAVPQQRVMCFFNPLHGPSTADVLWTRPGYGPRRVPACSQDAASVGAKRAPEIRMVQVGARTTPYWTAGGAFSAYTEGYFASATVLEWAYHPAVSDAAAGTGDSGSFGTGVVGSSGHFDGGGFDGSGAGGGI